MTYEEIQKLKISNVISSVPEYKDLAKQCLSIAQSSTMKDDEISMWIAAAVEDLLRNDIDVMNNLSNGLIQAAIIMYVKGHFGNVGYGEKTEKNEKTMALESYKECLTNLSLSQDFLIKETN